MRSIKSHPNVVTLFGVCSKPETPLCIIMEYVSGGTLWEYANKNRIDLNQAIKFGMDISAGVGHLHSEGFLHCDLAARNLLVSVYTDEVRIKVADFGLAQYLSSTLADYSKLDEDALIPIRWTAVEVLRTHKVSQKSDVWAFGITMYEILDIAVPYFEIASPKDVAIQVLSGFRLQRPTKTPPTDDLWNIIQSCWQENPDRRPDFRTIYKQLSGLIPSDRKSSSSSKPIGVVDGYAKSPQRLD